MAACRQNDPPRAGSDWSNAAGKSNKEIASELNIAVYTIKSHVHNILESWALHTRLELASLAHSQRKPLKRLADKVQCVSVQLKSTRQDIKGRRHTRATVIYDQY